MNRRYVRYNLANGLMRVGKHLVYGVRYSRKVPGLDKVRISYMIDFRYFVHYSRDLGVRKIMDPSF